MQLRHIFRNENKLGVSTKSLRRRNLQPDPDLEKTKRHGYSDQQIHHSVGILLYSSFNIYTKYIYYRRIYNLTTGDLIRTIVHPSAQVRL